MNKRLIKSNDEGGVVPPSFNTVLYTGTGPVPQSITGVGFKPDLVWFKNGDDVVDHKLYDSVRGATKTLESSTTDAEGINANGLSSFDVNGFTVGGSNSVNGSGDGIVAWCWKAGGAAVTNTDGTITSQVSANTEAGFSIVSYTGNLTAGATVGHGLGSAPKIIIYKRRDGGTRNWIIKSEILGVNDYLLFTTQEAKTASGVFWNSTLPTTSLFSLGSSATVNEGSMIAYCFAEVAGFSKFGSYVGNGGSRFVSTSVDGDAGFEPAFVMIKRTNSTGNWNIWDSKRNPIPNDSNNGILYPNKSDAETASGTGRYISFDSNGFTINGDSGDSNSGSGEYIFMAFANQF